MSNYSTFKGVNNITLDVATRDGTGAMLGPKGTTGQRPGSPVTGYIRYNTTLNNYEQYTNLGWISIAAPPVITSVASATVLATSDPQTITINGANFDAGANVTILGANLTTTYTPATTTFISASQLVVTFTSAGGLLTGVGSVSGGGEAYAVKVTNSTGLASTLTSAFNVNDIPTWTTSAGNLGTIFTDTATNFTVAATDPESAGLTYAVSSGALPPSVTINSSTGVISGTSSTGTGYVSNSGAGVTYTAGITATDGSNTPQVRSFNIIKKWYDGSTEALAAPTANAIYNILPSSFLSSSDGVYWIKPASSAAIQMYCEFNSFGGWMLFASSNGSSLVNTTGATGTITALGNNAKWADATMMDISWTHCWMSVTTGTGSNAQDPNRQMFTTNGTKWAGIAWTSANSGLTAGTTTNGRNQTWSYKGINGASGASLTGSGRQNGTVINAAGSTDYNHGNFNTVGVWPHNPGTGGFWNFTGGTYDGQLNNGADSDYNNVANNTRRIYWFFR